MSKVTILPTTTVAPTTGVVFEALNDGLAIVPNNNYQATVTGTGAVTATVLIEVSNDGIGWITAATISLTATDIDTDSANIAVPWVYRRATLSAISGTSATVTVTMAA